MAKPPRPRPTPGKPAPAPVRATSSLDKKPGTLSGVDARAVGQAAQPLQEAKNQMRAAEMTPAQISYALAEQLNPAPAPQTYEITGSPAFNAKLAETLAQQQQSMVPNLAPGMNPNLPELFRAQTLQQPQQQNMVPNAQGGLLGAAQNIQAQLNPLDIAGIGGPIGAVSGKAGLVLGAGLEKLVLGSGKSILPKIGAEFTENLAEMGSASLIKSNTKTTKLTMSLLNKKLNSVLNSAPAKTIRLLGGIGMGLAFVSYFTHEVVGNYPFADFVQTKASDALNFAFRDAAKMGDTQLMQEAIDLQEHITNPLLKTLGDDLPYKNVMNAAQDLSWVQELQLKVNKKYLQDMQNGTVANGSVNWDVVRADQAAQEKASVDYYNSERIRTEQEILRLRAESRAADSAAARQSVEAQAAFWLEYQKTLEKMKREEMEAQAEFWLEYKKLVMKMNEESRGSSLNFGLLR